MLAQQGMPMGTWHNNNVIMTPKTTLWRFDVITTLLRRVSAGIAWANADPDVCRHMSSLDRNGLRRNIISEAKYFCVS